MYTITVPVPSYGGWGQRPPPSVHYNTHYHALLFPITVNQLSLRGKGEVWTAKGYWETFSLDTYGVMAGCTLQCASVCEERKEEVELFFPMDHIGNMYAHH